MRRHSRRSSGLADSSAHSRCCTLLLYGVKKATCGARKWPVTWVGVAGFEPAASSSRTKRAAKLRHTPLAALAAALPRGLHGPWNPRESSRSRGPA
jgi:hypothetical protein